MCTLCLICNGADYPTASHYLNDWQNMCANSSKWLSTFKLLSCRLLCANECQNNGPLIHGVAFELGDKSPCGTTVCSQQHSYKHVCLVDSKAPLCLNDLRRLRDSPIMMEDGHFQFHHLGHFSSLDADLLADVQATREAVQLRVRCPSNT